MGITEDLYDSYQYLAHCERLCHAPGKRFYHYYQCEKSTTYSIVTGIPTIPDVSGSVAEAQATAP